jgi:hypothetical protein
VEERCLYVPVPLLLNGKAPFGYRGTRHLEVFGARLQEPFEEGARRGVVALRSGDRSPSGFRMVVGGVWVTTLPLVALADRELSGVVCDDELRKTADQSAIVQDDRYLAMLHAVQPAATRLLRRAVGPRYQPPALPPLPAIEVARSQEPIGPAAADPVPDVIPAVWPRLPETRFGLAGRTDAPVFWIDEGQRDQIPTRDLEPDRFPWRVFSLTEGQAITLARILDGVPLHRLSARADVDFVRRAMERRMRVREVRASGPGFDVTLSLHLEGPLPAWGGGGRPGVPYCVVGPEGTLETGAIDGRVARLTTVRNALTPADRQLRSPFVAPRTSLRVRRDTEGGLEDRHVELALAHAHVLVGDATEDAERILLAALLGALAAPQLVPGKGGLRVEPSLPVGWPDRLVHLPLADTASGPVSLARLAATLGTAEVLEVDTFGEVSRLDALEHRFGYGHVHHAAIDTGPVFRAGLVGDRWVWGADGSALVWVEPTFRNDGEPAPAPGLRRASRGEDEAAIDWVAGYRTLFEGIQAALTRGNHVPRRAEGRGRLALVQLALLLGLDDTPLLVPTDGGGRRSVREIRSHGAARVVARHGVRLAEPWTFAVTRDELQAIAPSGLALRFADAPDVRRTLPPSEQGWLVREEVTDAGLEGWLGLRSPYDPTAAILIRTTGQLAALSDVERAVPCHGLLWAADGRPSIDLPQRRTAQLAGLRLYQSLARRMAGPLEPAQTDDARRYATAFVLSAWSRASGRLRGTAETLARLVPVRDPSGAPWGTLDVWLATPPSARPELPEVPPPRDASAPNVALPAVADSGRKDVQVRLADALGDPPIAIALLPVHDEVYRPAVFLDPTRSHDGRATLLLNLSHPVIRSGLASAGPAREALLLELARQVCAWGAPAGFDLDLLRAQEILLGQRFG